MAKHHKLELTESEIQALVVLRDKGEPAYLRERATALLKIHEGFSPHEVARRGLLKRRDPDTVYTWLRRYREHGIRGLSNKPGRGRKPAFSPKSPEEAESELLVAIGQDPGLVNAHQTRWTLRSLGEVVPWLEGLSLPAFIRSSHAWGSAISVPENICGVLIPIMLKNFLVLSKR